MKKLLVCVLALAITASLSAQNFRDNDFQKAGAAFEKQANEALEAGDYTLASELAGKASEQYKLSREYVSQRALVFRAANMLTLAKDAVSGAERSSRAKEYAAEITRAKVLLAEAQSLYSAQKWEESIAKSEETIALIKTIPAPQKVVATVSSGKTPLPKFYVVGPWDKTLDCYWNISKKPEVYNNPLLWSKLYEANKGRMRNPDNPNLIYPGMEIEIPPLKGEKREGTYQEGLVYEALP